MPTKEYRIIVNGKIVMRSFTSKQHIVWVDVYLGRGVEFTEEIVDLFFGAVNTEKASREILSLLDVSDQRELLLSFMKFRDQVYWGENEYTENEDIIDLWLLKESYNR